MRTHRDLVKRLLRLELSKLLLKLGNLGLGLGSNVLGTLDLRREGERKKKRKKEEKRREEKRREEKGREEKRRGWVSGAEQNRGVSVDSTRTKK